MWYTTTVGTYRHGINQRPVQHHLDRYMKKLLKKKMQVIHSALCLHDLLFHLASAHFTEHRPSVLITGFKSLPGVKGLIAAYVGHNPCSNNLHLHRLYNFHTLSSGFDSNVDDRFNKLKMIYSPRPYQLSWGKLHILLDRQNPSFNRCNISKMIIFCFFVFILCGGVCMCVWFSIS